MRSTIVGVFPARLKSLNVIRVPVDRDPEGPSRWRLACGGNDRPADSGEDEVSKDVADDQPLGLSAGIEEAAGEGVVQ